MSVDPSTDGAYMQRRFAAPPERVFGAWTDPALARQWLLTGLIGEILALEMDARVGGVYRLTGERLEAFGEFLELDRPRRLVMTFGVPSQGPSSERLVVEIAPSGTGSELSLTKQGLPTEIGQEPQEDWDRMFDRLEAAIR
jgi:uncharacterized protein YndB with AHSA1/START domain